MSHSPTAPSRIRSQAEWSYRIRRQKVLSAIRDPRLSPAARQVLVHFRLGDDDPFVQAERPDPSALAAATGLAPRSIRRALAELVRAQCLTFRQTGEAFRPAEEGSPVPHDRPDLAREQACLAEARSGETREEHVESLARLRDRAAAAGRVATAIAAERQRGRVLGLCRPPAPAPRPAPPDEGLTRFEKKRRYLEQAAAVMLRSYPSDPHYGPLVQRFCDQAEALILENRARAGGIEP